MVKISVIIPVYNSAEYLAECLDSVINQTYQDMEIILVDDGSTDSSLDICRGYAKKDERISVFHQENQGAVRARKMGVKKAIGDYITFVDSDDWIAPCFLRMLYQLAERYQADMAASGCMMELGRQSIPKINQFEARYYDKETLKDKVYPAMLYFEDNSLYRFGILQYLWGKLYRREFIEPCIWNLDEGIYDGEDVACVFDACLRASSIVIDNQSYYHYRIREDSICTSKRDEKYFVNAVRLYRYMEQVFRDSGEGLIMLPQLKHFIAYFMNNGMKSAFGCGYEKSYSYFVWTIPELPKDDNTKIALFGAGNVGQAYCRQLLQRENIDIAIIVDNHAYGSKIEGMDVKRPEALFGSRWDYVLVAVKKEKQAVEIIEWLKEKGISEGRILYREPERKYPLYEFQLYP